jgi:hypothetical protein
LLVGQRRNGGRDLWCIGCEFRHDAEDGFGKPEALADRSNRETSTQLVAKLTTAPNTKAAVGGPIVT